MGRLLWLLLSLLAVALASDEVAEEDHEDVVEVALEAVTGDTIYKQTRTPCDLGDCVSGGCLFELCKSPVSCSGGLCVFKKCKTAVCEGGLCTFDGTDAPSCPGGSCRFVNMATTLKDGFCHGGACTLDGEPLPSKFSQVLSE